MTLQNNPFFILNISCSAGRREIISAAEEMSFMLDPDVCTKAQNELINLNKRLSAEISWFNDVDDTAAAEIRECIENGRPVPTAGLVSLSKLNATVYNFVVGAVTDPYMMGYIVLNIDEQFYSLDVGEITSSINRNRTAAKLAPVQEQDVSAELGNKREEIRQIITDKLSAADTDSYVRLVTMLAEKYSADDEYDDRVIISDVIDQYEVRMQSVLEKHEEEIEKKISSIKKLERGAAVEADIKDLIESVRRWDIIAQPLQLKSQASGIPHKMSEHLGNELRQLSVFLHNEKGSTKEALMLVEAMKGVFAELGILSEQFETDSNLLNQLLEGEKGAAEFGRELKEFQEESERIKSSPFTADVAGYNARIRSLHSKLKSQQLEPEMKEKIRVVLCVMAREASIALNNVAHRTEDAWRIADTLAKEFGDIQALRSRLFLEAEALNIERIRSQNTSATHMPNRSGSTAASGQKRKVPWLLLIIIGILLVWLFNPLLNSSNTSGTGSAATEQVRTEQARTEQARTEEVRTEEVRTEEEFTAHTAAGTDVYADIKSILPKYGSYMSGQFYYHHYICSCTTVSGMTIWANVPASLYKEEFDPEANHQVRNFSFAEEVTLPSPKRIHGIAVERFVISVGMPSEVAPILIDVSSVKE